MSNYLEILMITVALILVVVIWSLSSVLSMIAKKVVEAAKANKKFLLLGLISLTSMMSSQVFGQDAVLADTAAAKPLINYGGMSYAGFWTMTTVIGLELLVVLVLVVFIRNLWKVLHPAEVTVKVKDASWWLRTWHKLDKQFFTRAIPIEKEADVLLDHDYDGIKELDNALPPWWKYGFYITICVACFYLLKYEIWHTGPNPTEEYVSEMSDAKIQTDAYLASMKENVDEKTVTLADAAGIATGKELFSKTCIACHMSKGEGGVGPNLTDDFWLHGGSINDIFKTIKYGYPDKGMQSWQTTYSPIQIQQLASYIKSLKGTNPPNAKAPQGDLYKEVIVMDSTATKVKKDTAAVK